MKPTVDWTEDDVLSLPPGENDSFERKGAPLLDLTLPQVREDSVRDELAKQLSAFANTGGGRIIYGLTNSGAVDSGGVARSVRGRQSTREWLENVIPTLTDLEIVGFNVFEILPKPTGSSLASDKSIYVVDVPNSELAPHQSKRDLRYYVRLGGNSQPASHRLIEDIRNRSRHPKLEVHDLRIVNASASSLEITGLRGKFQLVTSLSFGLRNKGRVRATSACLQLSASVPIATGRFDNMEYFTRSAIQGTVLLELKNPLYPGMGITLGCPVNTPAEVEILPQGESLTSAGQKLSDIPFCITTFADSAPAEKQEFRLSDIDMDHIIAGAVDQEVRRIGLSARHFGRTAGSPWQ